MSAILPFGRITVLSPHRDDAVFSLALTLHLWANRGIRCRILNFFTESQYAPRLKTASISEISRHRQLEDRKALRRISPLIEVQDVYLKDAPLRLGLAFDQLMRPQSSRFLSRDEIGRTSRMIEALCRSDLVMAPLALGFHVDHQLIRLAGLQAIAPKRLGFYEDLPYATWTAEEAIQEQIRLVGRQVGNDYNARYSRHSSGKIKKLQSVRIYDSQINSGEARSIAGYSGKYKSAERIWLPHGSNGWNAIS